MLRFVDEAVEEGAQLAAGGRRFGDKVRGTYATNRTPPHVQCRGDQRVTLLPFVNKICDAPTDPRSQGYFIQPTVLLGVTDAMRVSRDEIFGPVMAIMRCAQPRARACAFVCCQRAGTHVARWHLPVRCRLRAAGDDEPALCM